MPSPSIDQRSDEAMVHLVRRLACAVVTPACGVLIVGIVRLAGDAVPTAKPAAFEASTIPLQELTMPGNLLSPLGMLTTGLTMFAAIPAVTLAAIAAMLAFQRRWREVFLTCGVLLTLGIAACMGHR